MALAANATAAGAAGPYAAAVSADSPIIWWRLDDPVGSTTGSPTAGRFVLQVSPQASFGVDGALDDETDTAMNAGGSGAYAVTATTTAVTVKTVEFWYQAGDPPGARTLISEPGGGGQAFGWSIGVNASGFAQLVTNESSGTVTRTVTGPPTSLDDGNWHAIVAVINTNSSIVYVDGTGGSVGGSTAPGPCVSGKKCSTAGGSPNINVGVGDYGTFDEIALYATKLTAAQVTSHYSAAAPAVAGQGPDQAPETRPGYTGSSRGLPHRPGHGRSIVDPEAGVLIARGV